jgi:hypothetical protein
MTISILFTMIVLFTLVHRGKGIHTRSTDIEKGTA